MKKLLLILLCLPFIGLGQIQYRLDSVTIKNSSSNVSFLMTKFIYDSSNRCITELKYTADGVLTYPILKYENTFNINNRPIETLEMQFDTVTSSWFIQGRFDYSYDVSNNLTELIYNDWNPSTNLYDSQEKEKHYYNLINERTHSERYYLNNNQFVLISKLEYVYQFSKPSNIFDIYIYPSSILDTTARWDYSYVGNNLSFASHYYYSNSTILPEEETEFFYNSKLLNNTAIPNNINRLSSINFQHYSSLGLIENQIDSTITTRANGSQIIIIYHYSSLTSSSINEHYLSKELLKVTDLLGRETKGTKDEVLFYIYDDGTVEKRIVIE